MEGDRIVCLAVQALSGLALATRSAEPLERALGLWRERSGHDFSLMWGCTREETPAELTRAAEALGRGGEAAALRAR